MGDVPVAERHDHLPCVNRVIERRRTRTTVISASDYYVHRTDRFDNASCQVDQSPFEGCSGTAVEACAALNDIKELN